MLAIVAPMTIAIKSIQSSQFALEQNTATFLAQEALSVVEYVRNADALDYREGPDASPDSWDLIPVVFADCYGTNGCNFDVDNLMDDVAISSKITVKECDTDAVCTISFNPDAEPSVFNTDGTTGSNGEDTGFVRRVYLQEIDVAGVPVGVIVRVEVKWQSHFLGEDKGVELVTSLYDRYRSF